jgi:hypothetical protein
VGCGMRAAMAPIACAAATRVSHVGLRRQPFTCTPTETGVGVKVDSCREDEREAVAQCGVLQGDLHPTTDAR